MYDFLIVGAGLFGSVFAHEMRLQGYKCLVIDKRDHIGGNCYTERKNGIHIHKYGPHIFHTSNEFVWNYVQHFCEMESFEYKPKVYFEGKMYSFPLNMMTFNQLWGCTTPDDARKELRKRRHKILKPKNLEEWCLSQVGTEIYEIFFKGYSEKQWGRPLTEMPCFLGKRIPIRFEYNENYYNDKYQGIPKGGYTRLINQFLYKTNVKLNTDFFSNRHLANKARKIIFTGCIDEYFDYQYGKLDHRTLSFVTNEFKRKFKLGNVAINYADKSIAQTRSIEHKFFEWKNNRVTYVTNEFPAEHKEGDIPFYPVNNDENMKKYNKYLTLSKKYGNVFFGGRNGTFQYMNMDHVIQQVIDLTATDFVHGSV